MGTPHGRKNECFLRAEGEDASYPKLKLSGIRTESEVTHSYPSIGPLGESPALAVTSSEACGTHSRDPSLVSESQPAGTDIRHLLLSGVALNSVAQWRTGVGN